MSGRAAHRAALLWKVPALLVLAALAISVICGRPLNDWFVDDTRFAEDIRVAANRHGIDPQLVRALIFQETRFRPFRTGRKGEIGLMQVLPEGSAADWARVNKRQVPGRDALFEPAMNLEIGCWYLSRALRRWKEYDHGLELALAQYNAGFRRADRWKPEDPRGEVLERIDIPSTRSYVKNICVRYRRYLKK